MPMGELAHRLREFFSRLEQTIGFYVRVKRISKSPQSLFPLKTLWGGVPSVREGECTTCYQGAEEVPSFTKQSVLYENLCTECVPSAQSKEALRSVELKDKEPAL